MLFYFPAISAALPLQRPQGWQLPLRTSASLPTAPGRPPVVLLLLQQKSCNVSKRVSEASRDGWAHHPPNAEIKGMRLELAHVAIFWC